MFPEIAHETLGTYRSVRIPMRFRDADVGPRGPAPRLGQHTTAVLAAAGYAPNEIHALAASGAVQSATEEDKPS
jgi:crotonobetainyl-CoA:carnitine CoA-transferase CaiB-like acyl-CoA transferase